MPAKRKVLVLIPILVGTFVGGVFASTTPLGGSLTSMFITNWPHTQNVTVTNWPKIQSNNTTVIVKTVYINTTTIVNATKFFIVGNHTIPYTGPYTKAYGQVTATNQYCTSFLVVGGNVTFTPYDGTFPTVKTSISSSAYYQADLPTTQYLAHVYYYSTPGGCGYISGDFYTPVTLSGNITRIDLKG